MAEAIIAKFHKEIFAILLIIFFSTLKIMSGHSPPSVKKG